MSFSAIKIEALNEHLFDPSVTNLEDILWASEEIKSVTALNMSLTLVFLIIMDQTMLKLRLKS